MITPILIVLFIVNYLCYMGLFLDKTFRTKKEALLYLIPFYTLGYGVVAISFFIWELAVDVWNSLS